MAINRTYECPDCLKQFNFMHHPNDEPPPKFCPLCGADVSGEKKRKKRLKRAITAPAIGGSAIARSADGLFRQMESAADVRQEQAAAMLGVDKSTLNSMKMTDMKDNMRAGDFSHVPSAATKLTGSTVRIDGVSVGEMKFQDRTQGAEYAQSVGQGPHPFAGNTMRETVNLGHARTSRQVVASGQINKK